MANIKSAKKRTRIIKKKRLQNNARRSELKTVTRKVTDALEEKDLDSAKKLLCAAVSKIARAKGKGVLKKNTAARKISKIAKKVAASEKAFAKA